LLHLDPPGNGVPAAIPQGGQAWQHLVPLSEQALQLLNGLVVYGKPASEWVFPARKPPRSSQVPCWIYYGLRRQDHPRHPRRLQDLGDRAANYAREVSSYACRMSKATRWSGVSVRSRPLAD
jgi:integrase